MEGAFEFRSIEGEPFDVDATPEAPMSNAEPTTNAYGEAALKRACRTIARSSVGDRNDTLNKEAFSIAQLVAGGVIAEHVAMDRLSAAAKAADLKTDETTRTLASAIAAGELQPRQAPAPRAPATHLAENRISLDADAKGNPKKIVANILTVFARDPRWKGVIGYDAFRETPVLLRQPPQRDDDAISRPRSEWTAIDSTRAAASLSANDGLDMPSERVTEAMLTTAQQRLVHPVRDYLTPLVWDGTPRSDAFFCAYCGTPNTRYARGVARLLFLAAVARVRGCDAKVDTIPILEGLQRRSQVERARDSRRRVVRRHPDPARRQGRISSAPRRVDLRARRARGVQRSRCDAHQVVCVG